MDRERTKTHLRLWSLAKYIMLNMQIIIILLRSVLKDEDESTIKDEVEHTNCWLNHLKIAKQDNYYIPGGAE